MAEQASITNGTRLGQVLASVVFCFLTAGVVFGYAALKPVLITNGVYSELCPPGEVYCKASDIRLNFMFTLATVVTNGAALPIGSLLDRYGPKKTAIAGALIFALGNVVFGLQRSEGVLDTYVIGYALLALGSPAIFLSQFHLSNAFPKYSGLILAAITGAFDASSMPYLFYREAFQRIGKPSLRTFFWIYTIVPALIIIQQLVVGPKAVYNRDAPLATTSFDAAAAEDDDDENAPLAPPRFNGRRESQMDPVNSGFSRISYAVPANVDDDEDVAEAIDKGKGDGIVGALFGKTVKEQATSGWFWLVSFYLFVQMTRINWYLATVQSQLEYYTANPGLADTLTKAFTVLLPLGGILSIPLVGPLLDRRPTLDAAIVLVFMGFGFGALTMFKQTVPQLIGIGILTVLRPLFYTFVSDTFAKVFGFSNFGTLYGLAMTLSGLIGLVLTPMDILTKNYFDGDYTPINVFLIGAGLVTNIALAVKVWSFARKGRIALE